MSASTVEIHTTTSVVEMAGEPVAEVHTDSYTVIEVGTQGPPGDPAGADLHYIHVQTAPSTHVTVTHNLGKYPAIAAYDSAGTRVIGTISNETNNGFEMDFGATQFSGRIRCN